ncbi:phosphohydrolase, partial [Paracidovorax avenae]
MVSNERRYAPLLFRDLPVNSSLLIDVAQLRVGMYIQLELGWMNHPFPVSSFRIASGDQVATLQSLGLEQVRWVPARSDAAVRAAMEAPASAPQGPAEPAPVPGAGSGTPAAEP